VAKIRLLRAFEQVGTVKEIEFALGAEIPAVAASFVAIKIAH